MILPEPMNRQPTPQGASSEGCPFCKIARSEDQSVKVVCEGDTWVAFFPDDPATPGHTLVIPRAHFRDLWSLDPSLGADLMGAVMRVGGAIDRAISPEGMNLISSSGEAAEQTVFHLHLHIVPRRKDDGFGPIWPPETPMEEQLKDDVADLIRQECTRL